MPNQPATAAPTACPDCGLSAEYCHPPMHPPLDAEEAEGE